MKEAGVVGEITDVFEEVETGLRRQGVTHIEHEKDGGRETRDLARNLSHGSKIARKIALKMVHTLPLRPSLHGAATSELRFAQQLRRRSRHELQILCFPTREAAHRQTFYVNGSLIKLRSRVNPRRRRRVLMRHL